MPQLRLKKFQRGDWGGPTGGNFQDSLTFASAGATVTLSVPTTDDDYIVLTEVSAPAGGTPIVITSKTTTQFVIRSGATATVNWILVE